MYFLPFSGNHCNKVAAKWRQTVDNFALRKKLTGIVDSGASDLCFARDALVADFNPNALTVRVGNANGQFQQSSGTVKLFLPNLLAEFTKTGRVVQSFKHTLLCLGPICDAEYKVVFTKGKVIIYDAAGAPIITGWCERDGARLWRIALAPDPGVSTNLSPDAAVASSQYRSAYDLPSAESLVCYFHAAAGFPVRGMWLKAIKYVDYSTWPSLTLGNATAYFPSVNENLKGNMVQYFQ